MYEKIHIAAECCCRHNGKPLENGSLSTDYILSSRHILKTREQKLMCLHPIRHE